MNGRPETDKPGIQQGDLKTDTEKRQAHHLWDEYRRFHETAPIGYLTLSADRNIIDVNIFGAKMLGTTPRNLLGSNLISFVACPPETCYESWSKNILEGDDWQECELELKRTDGSRFFAILQGRQVASTGEIVIFATDITGRKLTENALKESERKYRELADLLAEGIFEADHKGFLSYANQRLIDSFGIDKNDFNRVPVFEFIADRDRNLARGRFARIAGGEDLGPQEYLMQRKDGTTFPALVHSLPVWREGELVGIRGAVFDISERQRAETALKESERKYRELAELLGAGIFEADAADPGGIHPDRDQDAFAYEVIP